MGVDRSSYLKEFVGKAKEDLEVAEKLLQDEYFESSCFHSQQAAEKYLKALLVKNDIRFKKIHDLEQLVGMYTKGDDDFKQLITPAKFLNPYYIESRYPDIFGFGKEILKMDAEKALQSAKEIATFVKQKLG